VGVARAAQRDGLRPIVASLEALIAARDLVPADGVARARLVMAETGERLGSVLTRLGLLSEQALAEAVSAAAGLPIAQERDYPALPVDGAGDVSPRFLRDIKAAPLNATDQLVEVAFLDPFDTYARHALALAFQRPVAPRVGRASDIEAALDRAYGGREQAAEADAVDDGDLERLADMASDAPAIRAVNRLIDLAVEAGASDIHLEPTETALHLRIRIDGVMSELSPLAASMKAAAVSRIKVMAGLNIAERRLPQDGRMRLTVRGHDIDLRVATSPTIHGESVVLRLLDRSRLSLDFDSLGFDDEMQAGLRQTLARPHGIMLVTGPTGSGKTTTLYAALSALNAPERKLLTIEDPIEYRLPGINQTQVAPQIGLTFASALRSFLRHDPDVMMVGEVRDLETAQVAVQAALTGHMILSTLHTNSAAAAITRLLDMGVEPFLITSTLNAILAQRLVRRLCPHCRQPMAADAPEQQLGRVLGATRLWRAEGCERCAGAGYAGRVAVAELLTVDESVARLILDRASAQEIETAAVAKGMVTMLRQGVRKVESGLTTLAELLRVTREA
jgi:general secretion pathway protein E